MTMGSIDQTAVPFDSYLDIVYNCSKDQYTTIFSLNEFPTGFKTPNVEFDEDGFQILIKTD